MIRYNGKKYHYNLKRGIPFIISLITFLGLVGYLLVSWLVK